TFGVAKTEAPARRAMECVEAIVLRAHAFNGARVAHGLAPVPLSVGAHYGLVTIGDVGSEGRLEMAVLGDAVNVASRLEALTRPLEVRAIVSDALMNAAGGPRPGWTAQAVEALPGRSGAMTIWTVAARPYDDEAG
ncbi:MAG: adenylate/guanylate cyclase domain-containing protein, partial [Pseudomonadota bacterium]